MSVAKARSLVAVESKKIKKSGGSPAALIAARQALAAEKLERYIEQVVATAPPLSPDQRDRLTVLLRGAVDSW